MRTKTASVMDFLSRAPKVSATVYEILAKEASDQYLKEGGDPNQLIANQLIGREFNDQQIHRVTELVNHTINNSLSKSASDQLFTFPMASVKGVKKAAAAPKQKKTAQAPEPDVYSHLHKIPDYIDVVARNKVSSNLSKIASAEEAEPAVASTIVPGADSQDLKRARADMEYAELDFRNKIASLRQAYATADEAEAHYAAAMVLGVDDYVPVMDMLVGEKLAFVVDAKRLETLRAVADAEHPFVQSLQSFKTAADAYRAAREKHAGLASAIGAGAMKAVGKPLQAWNKLTPGKKTLVGGAATAAIAPKLGMRRRDAVKGVASATLRLPAQGLLEKYKTISDSVGNYQ